MEEKLKKRIYWLFLKRGERRRRERSRLGKIGGRIGFKIFFKELLFWKMNGGCCFVFGRRMEMEKLLF